MSIKYIGICVAALALAAACQSPAERAAAGLAKRLVPQYRIRFVELADTVERYSFRTEGNRLVISGNSALSMAVALGRYLGDWCNASVSWYASEGFEVPEQMPRVDSTVCGEALVGKRFFLNYCTFGYTMPWWKWSDWERLIDWMALQGINMPLAITGQEAVWQEVWRSHGLTDDQIRVWFTGPAHLPWHRMCNIDGVDGPLPQGWIIAQEKLQKRILRRERELGMHPVLPAFAGHVPSQLKDLYPSARITRIGGWAGFPPENLPWFLSPQDSLYAVIQRDFLKAQTRRYGTDHIYGFDLFNEVDPPSWDPQTLAEYGVGAYESVASVDLGAEWLQMGWMFYYDRRHWTRENVQAYLQAVPRGKVTILDYYTENIPVWTLTDSFFGQPYIFCYLGNFGGNTRFAGPFRTESQRITDALTDGGAAGIGCTLEGFGINRWFYEYVLGRAWTGGGTDDGWLAGLDRRRQSPAGFWKDMADNIYVRGSFSEGALVCGRPCLGGYHDWRVIHQTAYDNKTLERAWKRLLDNPSPSAAWQSDAVTIGCQVLGNRFALLRDGFTAAYRENDKLQAHAIADSMRLILKDIAALAACSPQFRLGDWLAAAESFASTDEEKYYYRHNAWHILTTWGYTPHLGDYASRLWSGLVSEYYAPRWDLFISEVLGDMADGREFSQEDFDAKCSALEQAIVEEAPMVDEGPPSDVLELCLKLLDWL